MCDWKTIDLHKVTGPNNHTGPSKITDRLTRIITKGKTFQKTCKFGIVGRHRPTVHDPVNNIIFVVDTGSAVSLLPSTFDSERYYGPQDLLAVNHTQLIVQGLKTLNVHLGFAQSYPWTFRVANVLSGILGCDFLSCHGFHVDVKNRCLIDPEGSMFNDSTSLDLGSTIESSATQIESPLDCEHKLLAFAPSTLHTHMVDITEPIFKVLRPSGFIKEISASSVSIRKLNG